MSDRQCRECMKDVPECLPLLMCDAPDAKEQYCATCFENWACEVRHGEGCATVVWETGEAA